jgi:hypothetical protein
MLSRGCKLPFPFIVHLERYTEQGSELGERPTRLVWLMIEDRGIVLWMKMTYSGLARINGRYVQIRD